MRKRALALIGLGLLVDSSPAILQLDLCEPLPDCVSIDQVQARFKLFGLPDWFRHTGYAWPDGDSPCWHLLFNHDGVLPNGMIERLEVCVPCVDGLECLQWWPWPFSVFYETGPAPAVPWEPVLWSDDCCGAVAAEETPVAFELRGAFPNPFNPRTTIEFALPETGPVRLQVHALDGRLVATLVDGRRERGRQRVAFDGAELASGVYVCTLRTASACRSRKMLLLK